MNLSENKGPKKTLTSITPHRIQRQIIDAVKDPNNFYVVVCAGRQIGKTIVASNICLEWAVTQSNKVIYWVSPSDSQCHKVYMNIVNAVHHTGVIKKHKGAGGDTEIIFKNGSKILFRSAAAEDNLRGESVHYMVLDECAFIKATTVNVILKPMLLAKGIKVLAISTPKGKNWFYKWWLRGNQLDSEYKSFRFKSIESPIAKPKLIEDARLTMSDAEFKQEYEAEFVDKSAVFDNVDELMVLKPLDKPIEGGKYWAGVDIGLINDSTVLTVINDNGYMVAYKRWTNIDSSVLVDELVKMNKLWHFQKMLIETNNQGTPIIHYLKKEISNVREFTTTGKSKTDIINQLIFAFKGKKMQLVDDDMLRDELSSFVFTQSEGGYVKFKADSGKHDDMVMSLAIARECWERFRYNAGGVGFY